MSAHQILVWLSWGFFMGLGWALAQWLVSQLTRMMI